MPPLRLAAGTAALADHAGAEGVPLRGCRSARGCTVISVQSEPADTPPADFFLPPGADFPAEKVAEAAGGGAVLSRSLRRAAGGAVAADAGAPARERPRPRPRGGPGGALAATRADSDETARTRQPESQAPHS